LEIADFPFNETQAPMSVCKGPMKSVNPYEVTYVSIEQEKRNEQYVRENNARIAALRKLSPRRTEAIRRF